MSAENFIKDVERGKKIDESAAARALLKTKKVRGRDAMVSELACLLEAQWNFLEAQKK
jgi:hypothetical protein